MSTLVVTLIVALAAPLGAYLVAAQRLSGRIVRSDATDLWAESRAIREWAQTRIEEQDGLIARLEDRTASQQAQIDRLQERVRHLTDQLVRARARVLELEAGNG